ncbi:MAG: hypothetical protein JWO71_4808 [Candidatus Acidoferrum typicum]|nr:hypothetical protein [Candidatus Acidoferrum typicum]MCU1269256.1 hypothetical protein [Acidobacteriaceae bacterium]
MPIRVDFQLVPLDRMSIPPFDLSQLPFVVLPDIEVADVSDLLPPAMFEYLRAEVGGHRMRVFHGNVKHALVHKYEEPEEWRLDEQQKKEVKAKGELINEVFACSRIVRPTRRLGSVSGYLTTEGRLNPGQTTFPDNALDVPEALKLFAFRNRDLEELRILIGTFLTAMHGEYWPFRMAVQYYYMGYEVNDWKGRFLYWGSAALHALYSPKSEKLVRRIKAFLGETTLIYPPDEHPEFEFLPAEPTTVGDVIEDINIVRNCIAHGERIADGYFQKGRHGLNGQVSYIAVLDDSLAFIVRETLRRILAMNLINNFTSRRSVSFFWKAQGL